MERIARGDADTIDRRSVHRPMLYSDCPDVKTETVKEGADSTQILTFKDIRLTRYTHYDGGTKVKFFVDEPAQLTRLLEVPYVPIRNDLSLLRRERAETGDKGLFMLDLGDPLCVIYNLMGPEDFALATATDYNVITSFLDEMYPRVLDLYRYYLENDACDAFFIVGAEFAGPPLVSPQKFNEMSVRYVKGICDLIREYGKISIVHYHGNLKTIRSGMREIGPDGLHTVEQPPIGNCTLTEAKEGIPGVALIGPVQYDDLIRLSPEEIRAQVRAAYAEMGDAPFILSPTAGPYEEYIDERAVRNYLAFIDAGLEFGKT